MPAFPLKFWNPWHCDYKKNLCLEMGRIILHNVWNCRSHGWPKSWVVNNINELDSNCLLYRSGYLSLMGWFNRYIPFSLGRFRIKKRKFGKNQNYSNNIFFFVITNKIWNYNTWVSRFNEIWIETQKQEKKKCVNLWFGPGFDPNTYL